MAQIIEKELSYEVVNILLTVQKNLGGGYQEKYHQKAIAEELRFRGLPFKEQLHIPLKYKNVALGHYLIDFVIDGKIVLEIKSSAKIFYPRDVQQVLSYLKASDISLGILANFTRRGVYTKRILRGSR